MPQQPAVPNLADTAFDQRMMRYTLALGERGLGRCWPNPAVGCVIVRNGRILAAAHTADGGRPHAETLALQQAGADARGATAYVTLEPCAHHGHTPPCTQALIDAGITRVVIGCTDPDSRVAGQGIAQLQAAGITVTCNLLQDEAIALHAGFFSRITRHRPLVAMKLATSLDGRISNADGHSQWITGDEARAYGHLLRSRYDAILTGIGTVLADDPALTCRLPGLERYSPVRVVLDGSLRLPPTSQLAQTASTTPLWVCTTSDDNDRIRALEATGVEVIPLPAQENGHVCIQAVLEHLAERGITRLLAEGGGGINGSLWQQQRVDRLYWFRAPIVLGDSGQPAICAAIHEPPSALPRLQRHDTIALGSDMLEIYSMR